MPLECESDAMSPATATGCWEHLLRETALSELIRALWLPGDMREIYSRIRRAARRCMR
jgi:hypothetical protein